MKKTMIAALAVAGSLVTAAPAIAHTTQCGSLNVGDSGSVESVVGKNIVPVPWRIPADPTGTHRTGGCFVADWVVFYATDSHVGGSNVLNDAFWNHPAIGSTDSFAIRVSAHDQVVPPRTWKVRVVWQPDGFTGKVTATRGVQTVTFRWVY
jgi:hypothetical protein